MGETIENGTIHVGEIIGKTLDGKDIYKFTDLGMAENVKIIEPKYKDGDFVVNMRGSILIFKKKVGNRIFDHAYFIKMSGEIFLNYSPTITQIKRYATEAEKQELLNALAKEGKRWNEEKKCIEDIPKRKFNVGDKVVLKSGYKKQDGLIYLTNFDHFIGKPLTIKGYTDNGYVCFSDCEYIFEEDWLEPGEELKKGDLAIFWNNGVQHHASVRMYGGLFMRDYCDTGGVRWDNAIKFESKEQYEKLINGEL